MKSNTIPYNKRNPYDFLLRSISFSYIGILIFLPIIAIALRAFQGGLASLWADITLPQALFSMRLTLFTALVMVIINIITGTATAWVLVRYNFPGKNVMNALIDIPFAMPTIVAGIMLVAIYGPKGVIGTLFHNYDIEIMFNKPGIIIALLFVTFPFVVRAVQPVLIEMDKDMEEAAKTLGASSKTIFIKVVLPSLAPSILTGAALSFSRALGEFGSIIMVAGNIPFKTQVAPVFIYGEIESYNPAGALGVSIVLLLFSFITLVLLNFIQYWNRRHEEQ